jgi:hypothetical protein
LALKGFLRRSQTALARSCPQKKRRTQVTRAADPGRWLATSEKLGDHDVDAHSRFGGSVATRVLRCPASVRLVEKVPAHLRKSSASADRGTALHAATPLLIENECSLAGIAGKKIDSYVITLDDVENALRPVLTYVETLLDHPGAEYFIERRVFFPTIPGAFGTCDLIVRIGSAVHIIDFKFGTGVRVLALHAVGDEDIINAQLLFYAAAARHSMPTFFAGVDNIVLTILQPMSIEPDAEMVSSVEIIPTELDEFIAIYRAACDEALSPTPRLERGAHCRFCPARPICPAHTGPLLDLAQFASLTPSALPSKQAYLQVLADGLNLGDAVKDIVKALHDQAKQALHAGDTVPGYALSEGRAVRHWHDENDALAALIALGLVRDDVVAETMRSPKQVEIRAKARGLKVPKELIVSHPSGVSLVRVENARAPVPGRSEIVRSFSAAITAFKECIND